MRLSTNKLAWRYLWPDQCYSGTLATGGGLLFVGRNDGRLTALDSAPEQIRDVSAYVVEGLPGRLR